MKRRFLTVFLALAISSCLVACRDRNAAPVTTVEVQADEVDGPEQPAGLDASAVTNEEAEEEETQETEEEEWEAPFLLDRMDYEYEQLLEIHPIKINNDPGTIVWTSEDPNIAQVVNGRLLYLTEGETVISADSKSTHREINVRVNPSIVFQSPLEGVTVKEQDKYILVVDNDVTIPDGFEDTLGELMTLVEKRTGLSYSYAKEEDFYLVDPGMIFVVISDKIATSFASADSVFLKSEHLLVDEANGVSEEKVYAVILEELVHCVQLRHSVDLGNALSEGYAIVNAYKIVEEDLGYTGAVDEYAAEQVEYLKWFNRLSSQNVYSMLIDEPVDVHPYSFFFVKYLYEAYGDSILNQLIEATNTAFCEKDPQYYGGGSTGVLASEDFRNVLFSEISESVLSDYVNWMRENQYN